MTQETPEINGNNHDIQYIDYRCPQGDYGYRVHISEPIPKGLTCPNHNIPLCSPDAELEQLFREAESTTILNSSGRPKPCEHIDAASLVNPDYCKDKTKCIKCGWWFCTKCASILDPVYCCLCLTEPDAELRESPLTDAEGVTHSPGRVLTPANTATFFQPRFGTLAKSICEMSDYELESHIDYYKDLVRQAEKALDFRRVVLGSSQLESEQRKSIKRRHLAADKTVYPIKTVSLDKTTGKQVKKTASLADMAAMLEALNKLKGTPKP